MTTKVQKEADAIDCDLAHLERRLEDMVDKAPKRTTERENAYQARGYVGLARALVRRLMSDEQRNATPY